MKSPGNCPVVCTSPLHSPRHNLGTREVSTALILSSSTPISHRSTRKQSWCPLHYSFPVLIRHEASLHTPFLYHTPSIDIRHPQTGSWPFLTYFNQFIRSYHPKSKANTHHQAPISLLYHNKQHLLIPVLIKGFLAPVLSSFVGRPNST